MVTEATRYIDRASSSADQCDSGIKEMSVAVDTISDVIQKLHQIGGDDEEATDAS